ncbi:hypothetical protein BDW22DRAFT_1344900 [Trametopsis cervina]|nr:hypothetical protein BDW22DRAFT_1344900 [Trametopsis cervina]
MASASELNVSLEPHLADALHPLVPLLPELLASQLSKVLTEAHSHPKSGSDTGQTAVAVVPYALLSSISAWSRSPEGLIALNSHDPPLDAGDYTMIALLAGTRTSPDRKFPAGPRPSDSDEVSVQREMNDRRAVTALLNALLSIIGAGVATYWAADKLSWRNEWKVLFALFVAIVVAASEAGLYLIWNSRRSRSRPKRRNAPSNESTSTSPLRLPLDSDSTPSGSSTAEIADITHTPPPQNTDTATPNVQIHRTLDGLRARTQGMEATI